MSRCYTDVVACWVSVLGYQARPVCKISQDFMPSTSSERAAKSLGWKTVNKGLWDVARGCLVGRDQGYNGVRDQ